ncbi:sugar-1,4-lactone oxidase-like protein/FAD-linked oxidoreductase [Thermosporothrix hazakensis]|jgi:FAD-linked oxidoreductase|uniref:Sugar-1,4-lactone oxidase-like protein/FAD-linked oxidoreductase n=2 Tax=Thermosporothrix TaxID=768650 RepID=A0A326U482_THEHA|nr:D-arabinono-1,4-lactone oxidase [Thermosporothrix hazakensis]PZW27469.1 sugar-1,4-lactone oxidase-like protein/FAD-linked oxidoreductase [Thermosporothrix hazakensis]BBH85938.1 FAD-binding oxidoreductase [Thermosporothrix sp. COM3]GCE45635.1 FAD-binding oxidoreductase [Thermosporothrix hazakensis]
MEQRWSNWSGSVRCSPKQVLRPESISQLVQMVKEHAAEGRCMRVVGTGHSFTPLVQTDDILISLDGLQGIEQVDRERGTVTVLAGTKLKRLGEALYAHGLAQENLGDIDVQSISGAISTGTHGTGIAFGTIATQVVGLTLITAAGELLECSEEQNPELLKAAQVSLGMLGIIVKVTLRVVPARRLHYVSRKISLDECLESIDRLKQENSHFEFYWFPYTKWVQIKLMNETQEQVNAGSIWATVSQLVLENGLFWLLSEACRLVPLLCPLVSTISAFGVPDINEVNHSHRAFATPRLVRFQEMEYNLPAEHMKTALEEIRDCINQHRFAVHFPIECRFVRGDDIWLSPAYQRDSAYIAIHMYRGMEYKPYFRHIEEIFKRYNGRPHWGKHHTRTAEQLSELYPRWNDFRRVREELDPQGLFLNSYLRELFYGN